MYGWVGSDDGWRRTKVGMIIAVEVAGIGHRGGKINNPAGCVHRADTYFGGCNVSASTLCIQGMRVGIKIGPNLLSVMTSRVGMTTKPLTL